MEKTSLSYEDDIIRTKNVKELTAVLKAVPKTVELRINGWSQATNKMYNVRKKIFGNIVKIAGVFFTEGSYDNSAASDCDSGTIWKPIAKADVKRKLDTKLENLQKAIAALN